MTVKNLKSELKNLLIISKKYKIGVPEMSLLYCLKQENIDMVLFGVESTNQLIENLKSSTENFHIYTFGGLKETNKWLEKNNYA